MPIDTQNLIERMEWAAANDLRELFFSIGKTQVKIRREPGGQNAIAAPAPVAADKQDAAQTVDMDETVVTAPLAGMCHLRAEGADRDFVMPGDVIVEGQTLCVIEAMKVMTSIPAPCAGTLEAVLVADGSTVGVGAPLMRLV